MKTEFSEWPSRLRPGDAGTCVFTGATRAVLFLGENSRLLDTQINRPRLKIILSLPCFLLVSRIPLSPDAVASHHFAVPPPPQPLTSQCLWGRVPSSIVVSFLYRSAPLLMSPSSSGLAVSCLRFIIRARTS